MPKTRIYPPRGSSQLPNTRELSADSDEEFLNVYSSLDSLEESDNDIKSIILDQLRKYRHVSVRIKKNSKGDGRFAVLQFDNTDALNYFKRAILEKRDRIIVYDKVLFFNFNHANRRLPATERISDRISHRDRRNYSPERSYSRSNRYDRSSENDRRPPIAVSRTLFVGNLDDNIETAEIRRVFEPYGELLEVVIKHPHAARSAPYAFVKYRKLSATINAREQLQDTYVGRKRLKIGFGKVSPSHALWVGGLNDNTNEEELLTEVKRHSRFADYEIRNDNHIAYFVFETIDDSRRAYNGLQNIKLVHSGAKLEVDYADTHVEAKDLMDKIRVKDNRRASRSSTRSLEDVSDRSRSPVNSQIRVNRKRHGSYSSSSYSSRRRSPNGVSRRSRSKECRSLENHEDTEIKSMELHKIDDGHKESVKRDSMISSPSNRHKSFKSGSNFSGDDYKDLPLISGIGQKSLLGHTQNSMNISLCQILNAYPIVWKGGITVKTNVTFVQLHLICGSVDPVSTMVHQATLGGKDATLLHLTERFSLFPDKVTDLRGKLATAIASRDSCILMAQPTNMESKEASGLTNKPISHLVSYFQQKQAGGVGCNGTMCVYAFPPSPFTQEQLSTLMPHAVNCLSGGINDNYLMVVISR